MVEFAVTEEYEEDGMGKREVESLFSGQSLSNSGPTKSTVGMTPVADMRKSHPITFR